MSTTPFNVRNLSARQLAGLRLMVGFDGTALNTDLKFLIKTLKVGGIILFSRNIESPDQLRSLCLSAQRYAASCGQPPLLIAVDQEGGPVARLKPPFFTGFPGNPAMQSEDDAVHFAEVTARELKQVGINMDMAPVMDIAFQDIQSIMASRAFGADPQWVSKLGITVIKKLQQNRIMAVAKHFPGIGRTTRDSHLELPELNTSLEDMLTSDLLPFTAAIQAGVAGIMLSHILYQSIDPQWPASLSRRIAGDLLRKKLGYEGIIITDDLDMKAIKQDIRTVIHRILAADIDIALICHKGPDIQTAFEEILKEIDRQEQPAAFFKSAQRIMDLKAAYLPTDGQVSRDEIQ